MSKLEDFVNVKFFTLTGEEKYFRLLYSRHSHGLYSYLMRIIRYNREKCDDIFQETWLRAFEGINNFRYKSAFSTWLFAIANNIVKEFYREEKIQQVKVSEDEALLIPVSENTNNMDLEKAISTLPEGYRQVLLLYDVMGFKHKEISIILDIEPVTSRSQLHKAREKVKKYLS